MKPRLRHIRNLYFRWGEELNLDASIIARALESAGLIQLTESRHHYSETEIMRSIPKQNFERIVKATILTQTLNLNEVSHESE